MTTELQSPIYHQPNWQVENVYQTINNYILPAERPPLWVGVPGLPAHFVGRDALLDNLVNRLLQDGAPSVAIHGLPGVGKSTVAVMVAHHKRLLAHFSDGVLWAGLGINADLPSILNRWATALEIDITELRTDAEKTQAIRDAIGHKRLLLVIDDAWQSDPAIALHCGGDNCAYLLTTRDKGVARKFASAEQTVEIPVLAEESAHLLLSILAPEAWVANTAAAAGLADAVGRLPLALELLGGYLAAPENTAFAELISESLEEMADPERRLELASRRLGDLSGEFVTLQATIALSLESLPPPALSGFYSLGAFAPKPAKFDSIAAQTVAGVNLRILALLSARNLMEIDPDESLLLHQTIADVARTRTPSEAITSHREHYLVRVKDDREDWQVIEAVYPQIQWAWQQTPPGDPATVEFVDILSTYQTRRGLWADRLTWLEVAVSAAESNADAKSQARMLHEFGYVYSALGEKEKALGYYEEALPLSRQVGDRRGEATTMGNIGSIYSVLGEKEKALVYFLLVLPLFSQMRDHRGEAVTLHNVGGIYADLGENEKALEYFSEVLPLFRQMEDRRGEAMTLNNIGLAYRSLDEMEKALRYYEQVLPLFRQMGDRSGEAMVLNNIGGVYDALGEAKEALGYYGDALPLIRQMRDRHGEATTLNNIGGVYSGLGEKEKALQTFEKALELRIEIGDKFGEIVTRWWLATLYQSDGDFAAAVAELEKALSIATEVHSPNAAAINRLLTQLNATQ